MTEADLDKTMQISSLSINVSQIAVQLAAENEIGSIFRVQKDTRRDERAADCQDKRG